MDKQRILKEAQKIAAKFSFWMVSGNIAHLYGYIYESNEKKYEVEIKFDENFPDSPPQFIYHNAIKELLGEFQLNQLVMWTPDSAVVEIIHELKVKIRDALNKPMDTEDQQFVSITHPLENQIQKDLVPKQVSQDDMNSFKSEKYITPDLNAYPADFDVEKYNFQADANEELLQPNQQISQTDFQEVQQGEIIREAEQISVDISTEIGLIQQYFAFDQKGHNPADLNVYMTITLTKTFIIGINFADYPERPIITFPDQLKSLLGDPYESLDLLKKWKVKSPSHIIDVLHELENQLLFIKDIEVEAKKILGEYQCDIIANSITQLKVHLLTYGFKEYLLDVDLQPYPHPPKIDLTPELYNIIQIPINSLNSYKNWKEKESEPIEVIREISWLVDKNSRINFEIALLKENYKNIKYNPATETLNVDMKGKMKTQDLTFEFQINLPREYPMKIPEIKVLNEFELESHEKIKTDLQASFTDFFNEWTPFSYLVDLFNLISKKIFEISVVACVICHKIECPTCQAKIAGADKESCHIACPYCERAYHKHCWEQTIKSFGKCGFCLKVPPPNMMS